MNNHSLYDWVSILGPMLLSWPLVIAVVLLVFRHPLYNLLEKVSGKNVQKAKIGPFEIEEAKEIYVESLQLLLTSFITKNELKLLEQLDNEDGEFAYKNEPELMSELKRLNKIDFIASHIDLEQIPGSKDLSYHIKLTPKGKKYLTLRDNLMASKATL